MNALPMPLLVAGVILVVLAGPALYEASRRAATARDEGRRQETDGWRLHPVSTLTQALLAFRANVLLGLQLRSREANTYLEQCRDRHTDLQDRVRGGQPITPAYRIAMLAGLVLFGVVTFGLHGPLDYQIFHGVHPGSRWLAALLAGVCVVALTVGATVAMAGTRHGLIPAGLSPYAQRVTRLCGAALAAGVILILVSLAPNRSELTDGPEVSRLQRIYNDATTQVLGNPTLKRNEVRQAKQALDQAKARLARAKNTDRVIAGVTGLVEVPLSEAAFAGGELVLLSLAAARVEQARRAKVAAEAAPMRAHQAFTAAHTAILNRHGHDVADVFHRAIDEVARLDAVNGTRQVDPDGEPGDDTGRGDEGDGGTSGGGGGGTSSSGEPSQSPGPTGGQQTDPYPRERDRTAGEDRSEPFDPSRHSYTS